MKHWQNIAMIMVLTILIIAAVIIVVITNQVAQVTIAALIISTVLTAVSSVATYVQALEARRQRENSERPEVAVYFQSQNRLIYCVIQNLGKLPARNVHIQFTPSPKLHDDRLLKDISLFAKTLPYLPPNEKYWRHLGPSPTVLAKNIASFEIHVDYYSTEGRFYQDRQTVDLSVLAEANDPEPSISYQLGKISDAVTKLMDTLEREKSFISMSNDMEDNNPYGEGI